MIYGFNILPFDRPLLAARLYFHKIDKLENILELFRKIAWVDLRQGLLPLHHFIFKGLSQKTVAQRLQLPESEIASNQISELYEAKDYDRIVEHLNGDIQFIKALADWLRKHKTFKKWEIELY